MIVSIHQPEHFPYLGFFQKMEQSDLFIILDNVKFKKNNSLIGNNTKNAIQNGIYWGYVGLVSFLIKKIQNKFKKKLFCVSTGGLSKIISKDISLIKFKVNITYVREIHPNFVVFF